MSQNDFFCAQNVICYKNMYYNLSKFCIETWVKLKALIFFVLTFIIVVLSNIFQLNIIQFIDTTLECWMGLSCSSLILMNNKGLAQDHFVFLISEGSDNGLRMALLLPCHIRNLKCHRKIERYWEEDLYLCNIFE